MPLIVQKFGGTSVASLERLRNVANKVIGEIKQGNSVIVILSAMSGETDRLINLTNEAYKVAGQGVMPFDSLSDYDSVISTGEQITCGLLAIILTSLGYKAKSMCGWQVPLLTNDAYSKALIENVESGRIISYVNDGIIPVITGFQGINKDDDRISTLGRGGSDTSAVAIAAALKADRCDIYTDVDGVYTTDPRITSDARRINKISFEEMLEMASVGAKVLQTRSVGLAMRYNVKLRVLSTFEDLNIGTILTNEDESMENKLVTAVVSDAKEVQLILFGLEDKPGVCAVLFSILAQSNINVDMIVQVSNKEGSADLTFTVNKTDLDRIKDILHKNQTQIGFSKLNINPDISKITIVGSGMKSNPGVAYKMFNTLAQEGINIIAISTSEIKISVLIDSKYTELAVRSLHKAFELEKIS